jgi:hypothetical protein
LDHEGKEESREAESREQRSREAESREAEKQRVGGVKSRNALRQRAQELRANFFFL